MDRQTHCIICKEGLLVSIKYIDMNGYTDPSRLESAIKHLDMVVESELSFLDNHKPSVTVKRWCPKCGLLYKE